jgi:hypothetical protein
LIAELKPASPPTLYETKANVTALVEINRRVTTPRTRGGFAFTTFRSICWDNRKNSAAFDVVTVHSLPSRIKPIQSADH